MSQKKKMKKRGRTNEDRVLRMAIAAVIILFALGAVFVGIKSLNPRPDIEEGIARLKKLDEVKVSDVESEIAVLDEEEAKELEALSKRSNKEIFKNTVIIGDFIAQGLCEQKVLSESYVFAVEDAAVYDLDATGVSEKLDAAVKAKPAVVFLELGVNDAAQTGQTAESFCENYGTLLSQVKEKLPNVKIYVNSILPVQQQAIAGQEGLADIPEYNRQLKELCQEENVAFLDNSGIVKEDYYKEDGKHMTKKYYTAWAKYMAEAAGL